MLHGISFLLLLQKIPQKLRTVHKANEIVAGTEEISLVDHIRLVGA